MKGRPVEILEMACGINFSRGRFREISKNEMTDHAGREYGRGEARCREVGSLTMPTEKKKGCLDPLGMTRVKAAKENSRKGVGVEFL